MGQSDMQSEGVAKRFFELLNAEDLEGVRALLTEDAAWLPQARDMPGPANIAAATSSWMSS